MEYLEYKAAQAYLAQQLKACGHIDVLEKPQDKTAPILFSLSREASEEVHKTLAAVQQEIRVYRALQSQVPGSASEARQNRSRYRAIRVFDKFRPSASVSIRLSAKKNEWGFKSVRTGKAKSSVALTISPAWSRSSYFIHKTCPSITEKMFILYSHRIGNPMSDGSETHRIRSVYYDAGRLLWDGTPYLSINPEAHCWGKGETVLKARLAMQKMMAKQLAERMRG